MPAGPARGAGGRSAKRTFLAEDAAGLDTGAAAAKLKAARQSLAQFVQATGGRQDSARESVSGFGRSAAGKATWAAKPFASFRKEYRATAPDQLLPGHGRAVIPQEKLTGYVLNLSHPVGHDKAVAFRDVLGYTAGNADDLQAALLDGLRRWKAIPRATTKYGQPFEVRMLLTGPNGRTATVKTGWIIDHNSDVPRLTSAYIYAEKGR